MNNNKNYYALYLKYKSKYLALKTGGAEPEPEPEPEPEKKNNTMPTLRKLIDFIPLNDKEREIYNIDVSKSILQKYLDQTKNRFSRGKYYLGGQIELGIDDEITPELIDEVKNINDNSFCGSNCEVASLSQHKKDLTSLETIISKYNEIQKMR